MSWPKMRKVSESEFHEFVADYPRQLQFDCVTIGDPPMFVYSETRGVWPHSVVACCFKERDGTLCDFKIRDEEGAEK